MLGSEQIGNLVMALGTSIGREEFNLDKLRYHKIIIIPMRTSTARISGRSS